MCLENFVACDHSYPECLSSLQNTHCMSSPTDTNFVPGADALAIIHIQVETVPAG
jgi:hypothetical protein